MHSLHHLIDFVQRHGFKHSLLYVVSSMIFFFAIADGILMYVLPLMIVEEGFSKTEMGIIIGSSSIAGAGFDLLLSKYLRRSDYRRLYLGTLFLTLLYAVVLYGASLLWIYLLAMVIWGLYWDLFHFGNFDFVSRTLPPEEHASGFGVIGVFLSLGTIVSPIIAGLTVAQGVTMTPFLLAGVMVLIALGLYGLIILRRYPHTKEPTRKHASPMNWLTEVHVWTTVGKQLFPLLVLLLLTYMTDSFFWTIGPLIAENGEFGAFGGLLLVAYSLPVLFAGWFVGRVTRKHGKKRTALLSFLLGSIFVSLMAFATGPGMLLGLVFSAAFFFAFTMPSINGAFADYISETRTYEKEIQGVTDFFYNLGWAIGPIISGFLADTLGNKHSFTSLGVVGILLSIVLFKFTPRKIKVRVT